MSVGQLSDQLEVLDAKLTIILSKAEALRHYTNEQLLWKPKPEVWCISQIVHHLYLAEKVMLPEFQKAIIQLRKDNKLSPGPFKYSFMEKIFIRIVSPNPPFKVPVPEIMIPVSQPDFVKETLEPFLALQVGCRQLYLDANGTDLKAAIITSPVNKRMRFCIGAYMEGIACHKEYHWLQIEAIEANPAFPKGN